MPSPYKLYQLSHEAHHPSSTFPPVPCCVYCMTAGKFTKIGISKDVNERFHVIQTGCPLSITRLAQWRFENQSIAEKFEKQLQLKFEKVWVHGEWFVVRFDEVVASMMEVCNRAPEKCYRIKACQTKSYAKREWKEYFPKGAKA